MQVNLCVKNQNPSIKYKFGEPIVIDDTFTLSNVNFQELKKEVMQLPKNKIKEYKRIIKTFLVTATSFLVLPLRSMANELPTTATQTVTTLPKTATGMPPELLELMLKLLVISVGAAVTLSMILLVGAGVMKMLRKKKEANEWTVDIIKGLIQVLVAVPVVFLIYYVANMLFSGNGWFVSPF